MLKNKEANMEIASMWAERTSIFRKTSTEVYARNEA